MLKKFEIPANSSYARAFEMLASEINNIHVQIDKLENGKKPVLSPYGTPLVCSPTCDGEYTGMPHLTSCPLYGRRS